MYILALYFTLSAQPIAVAHLMSSKAFCEDRAIVVAARIRRASPVVADTLTTRCRRVRV